MVKVILGSAAGGFAAAGLALVLSAVIGHDRGGVASASAPAPMMAPATGTTVACGPYQEAAVARVVVSGQEVAMLACVDRAPHGYVSYAPGIAPAVQPATMLPAAARAQPARQVVYRDGNDDVVRYEPDTARRRSVAKTAMIIGGSAGTGAGVGAIVGGKKGALIGAAIGGGAASIFEATKR